MASELIDEVVRVKLVETRLDEPTVLGSNRVSRAILRGKTFGRGQIVS